MLGNTRDSVRPDNTNRAKQNRRPQVRTINGVEEEEEEHVKAKQVKRGTGVTLPTEAEYEEHMISH